MAMEQRPGKNSVLLFGGKYNESLGCSAEIFFKQSVEDVVELVSHCQGRKGRDRQDLLSENELALNYLRASWPIRVTKVI